MSSQQPRELVRLLDASDHPAQDIAWEGFLRAHSRLLYHTAKSLTNGYDDTMDRYAFVLDQLRSDEFRRLRAYRVDGAGRFSTWLVAVAHRLCIDYHRRRYGRRSTNPEHEKESASMVNARRQLLELLGVSIDVDTLVDPSTPDPDGQVRAMELHQHLEAALASLDPRDRMLLKLRFDDGASVRDITRAMRWPSQFHVYKRLKKVLRQVRQRLESAGVSEPNP